MDKSSIHEESVFDENEKARYYDYSVQMLRFLMYILGAWPMESPNYPKLLKKALISVTYFLLLFMIIPYALFMFLIVEDFKTRLRLAGPASFALMNLFKYNSMLAKSREIRGCLDWMSSDWQAVRSLNERDVMLDSVKSARLYITICILFMHGSGMTYCMIFTFTQEPIVVNNVSVRQLIYPGYFIFFDPQVKPHYNFIVLTNSLVGFVKFNITCLVCSFAIICVMHICGQTKVMSSRLQELVGNFDEETFGKIIKRHLRFLKFASKLEDILNDMCLVELIGCTFNICMLGYYFITEYDPTNVVGPIMYCLLLFSFTFNIFILCYIGDKLTEQCHRIGDVAYMIDWYHLSGKNARNLILIVASAQHPIVITAGKLTTLSLTNFTSVLKASLSYLNFLRTITANAN